MQNVNLSNELYIVRCDRYWSRDTNSQVKSSPNVRQQNQFPRMISHIKKREKKEESSPAVACV